MGGRSTRFSQMRLKIGWFFNSRLSVCRRVIIFYLKAQTFVDCFLRLFIGRSTTLYLFLGTIDMYPCMKIYVGLATFLQLLKCYASFNISFLLRIAAQARRTARKWWGGRLNGASVLQGHRLGSARARNASGGLRVTSMAGFDQSRHVGHHSVDYPAQWLATFPMA